MNDNILRNLRCAGYRARTLLDIGAHVGDFTRNFLAVFPDCVPTLIEPNPHCQQDLARLPYERHAIAASDAPGVAELFLTREWLQSTGTSLFRENTHFFRDEVLLRHEVRKERLDTLFAGRVFDFVKIDTQGSELNILRGGRAVLRQADYILIEISLVDYNAGGAQAEAVFAELAGMGFHCVDVTEFHRLASVQNGNLLQLDALFARRSPRPNFFTWEAEQQPDAAVLGHLRDLRVADPELTVVGIGMGSDVSFAPVLSCRIDDEANAPSTADFVVTMNDSRGWQQVLRHVSAHGRFSYAVCGDALFDLANPAVVLEMLPLIAEAGYIRQSPGKGRWQLRQHPSQDSLSLSLGEAPAVGRSLTWRGALPFEFGNRPSTEADLAGTQPQFHRIDSLMAEGRTLDALQMLRAMKASNADIEAILARIRLLVNPAIHEFNGHMAKGAFAMAARYADALIDLLPRNAEIRAAAMSCMLACGRHADAVRHAKALLHLAPDNVAARQLLASRPETDDEAELRAAASSVPTGQHPLLRLRDLHDAIGTILCHDLDPAAIARVTDLLRTARDLSIDVPADSEWAAWERHYRLMLEGADPAWLRLEVPTDHAVPPDISVLADSAECPGWPAIQAAVDAVGAQIVFFAAADAAYVDLYARWYVQSVLRHSDVPCAVVLHVIGGRGQLQGVADRLGIGDPRVILSGDDFAADRVTTRCLDAPPRGTSAKPLAHLQSTRFLLLETLLTTVRRPVFVSDIDLILQRGVADLLAREAGTDIVLNENTLNEHAASRITANLVLVNPTDNAALFLRFLRTFLEQALAGPDVSRWIDQIGLLMARHFIRLRGAHARFGYFDTGRDINNVIYKAYVANPFRFLSLYHGFDMSRLQEVLAARPGDAMHPPPPVDA